MHSTLWKEIYPELIKAIPEEAIQEKTVGAKTQGYKIGYLIERLNEILAPRGAYWTANIAPIVINGVSHDFLHEIKKGKEDKTIETYCVRIIFTIFDKDENIVIATESFGGCNMINNSLGDTLKGAQTDALKKAFSYIGLGNEAFKGNIDEQLRQSSYKRSKVLASILGKYTTDKPRPGKAEFLAFLCDAIEVEHNSIDDIPLSMLEKLDKTFVVTEPATIPVVAVEEEKERPGRSAGANKRAKDIRENTSTPSPIRSNKSNSEHEESPF